MACALSLLAVAAYAAPAGGQLVGNAAAKAKATSKSGNGGSVIDQSGVNNLPNRQLTPEQMQSIMLYRALQSRGRGQVRTGVPQFIPLGMGGFVPIPQTAAPADQQPDTAKKSSLEKRIEARKAAEEKKRAAREAKKAKAKEKAAAKKAGAKPGDGKKAPDADANAVKNK